nr:hypothetical protein [uncultured Campylobacter sp.]
MAPIDIVKIIIFALLFSLKTLSQISAYSPQSTIFSPSKTISLFWNSRFILFAILPWSLINCALFFR